MRIAATAEWYSIYIYMCVYVVCSVPTTEGVAMVTEGMVYTDGGGGLALFTSLHALSPTRPPTEFPG